MFTAKYTWQGGVMDFRIFTEPQQGARYDDLLTVAQTSERLGFEGFFRSDHYLSMGKGDGLPGILAIQVAQVDDMSAGRVELGLGAGWFEKEHKA